MKKKNLFVLSLVVFFSGSLIAGNYISVIAQEIDNEPADIDHIEITPEEAYLEKGSGQQFHAHAYDSAGDLVEFNVIWATTGGTITQDGFYTATLAGYYQVFAIHEDSGITGEATVMVSCEEEGEACLAVIPGRVTMHLGEQVQFVVYEKNAVGIGQEVSCGWYTSGGTITHEGLFIAEHLGNFTITAVELETGRMGSAHVVVEEMHVLPWWAYTMMGSEWFWVMGLLLGLVAGLVVYMYRRSKAQSD
jgi:hypothetical protein